MQESRKHHIVPKLLLRPWLIRSARGQDVLMGFWWNKRDGNLACKLRGLDSFCWQLDLLSLKAHHRGRDAIEKLFFGEIDTKGAAARDMLLGHEPEKLSGEQRCDFARLLLSLEARRPIIVERLRTEGSTHLRNELDADTEIRTAFVEHGISDTPASYVENQLGSSLEDHALSVIQKLVDNPKVGGRLINAQWQVKLLGPDDGSLILSDRPLIRVHGYDRPGATWVLPLTPRAAFIACNDPSNMRKLTDLSGQRFVKAVNTSSAAQAERFVFCTDRSHEHWLKKHLMPKG